MQTVAKRFFEGAKRCWPTGPVFVGLLLMVPWLKEHVTTEPANFAEFGMTVSLGFGLLLCLVGVLVPRRWYDTPQDGRPRSPALTKVVQTGSFLAWVAIGFVVLSALDVFREWVYAAPETNRELGFALIVFSLAFVFFAMFVWGEWHDTESGDGEDDKQ